MTAFRTSADTMRAAVLVGPGRCEIARVPMPTPSAREVRVRIEGCGVCASNLEPWAGRPWFSYPFEPGAPGHEAYGWLDAVGEEVRGWKVGDRVAMLSTRAYAEFDVVNIDAVIALPPELNDMPVPAEPLACAMNIFARAGIVAGMTVAIVGIGFLGALLTQLTVHAGARVIALSRRSSARALAKQWGAQETIGTDDPAAAIAQVSEQTAGRFCDVVVEAAGLQSTLDLAAELTRERGRLVIAGYHQNGMRLVKMQLWNWRGFDVINAHERAAETYLDGMHAAVAALHAGRIDPVPLFTHRFPLAELGRALDLARDRPNGFMKALVLP
jgi:2-desacetyl-2-hydroxyethyl bacteriochlorophyllide A dehydrogenase